MENSQYWTAVTNARSMLLTDEESLEGLTLISAETCDGLVEDSGILAFIEEHPDLFLAYIRVLPRKDQDLLLSYYFLAKTQTQLGLLYGLTQTVTSHQLRLAVRAVCSIIRFDGCAPEASQMRPILQAAGLEQQIICNPRNQPVNVVMSNLIAEYIAAKSFQVVARHHGLHRPDIRRSFKAVSEALIQSGDPEQMALGSYVEIMIYKMSPSGRGYTKRAQDKLRDVEWHDSAILGQFAVDVSHPDLGQWFQPRANR